MVGRTDYEELKDETGESVSLGIGPSFERRGETEMNTGITRLIELELSREEPRDILVHEKLGSNNQNCPLFSNCKIEHDCLVQYKDTERQYAILLERIMLVEFLG